MQTYHNAEAFCLMQYQCDICHNIVQDVSTGGTGRVEIRFVAGADGIDREQPSGGGASEEVPPEEKALDQGFLKARKILTYLEEQGHLLASMEIYPDGSCQLKIVQEFTSELRSRLSDWLFSKRWEVREGDRPSDDLTVWVLTSCGGLLR